MNQELEECIEKCQTCRDVCLETLEYVQDQGADFIDDAHKKLLEDCAKICDTSVDFMERESDFHPQICGVCAEICEKCAEACETISDDAQIQACARACRDCAESCRQMSES